MNINYNNNNAKLVDVQVVTTIKENNEEIILKSLYLGCVGLLSLDIDFTSMLVNNGKFEVVNGDVTSSINFDTCNYSYQSIKFEMVKDLDNEIEKFILVQKNSKSKITYTFLL